MTDTRVHWLVLSMDDNLGEISWSSYHDELQAREMFALELRASVECDCFRHQGFTPLLISVEWGCTEHVQFQVTQFAESRSSVSFPTAVHTTRELLGYKVEPYCFTHEGTYV